MRSISPHSHAFPALDGLRGVAVALVLVVHAAGGMLEPGEANETVQSFWRALEPLVGMGGTGVHLFFVLSGFLLFLPFARHLLVDGRRPSTSHFYKRRALRIIPAYWLALTGVALWLGLDYVFTGQGIVRYYGLLQVYDSDTITHGIGQAWTVCIEISLRSTGRVITRGSPAGNPTSPSDSHVLPSPASRSTTGNLTGTPARSAA